ncbi:MAG: IS21 family transposase [Magnetococcus sp. YQC-5]
MAGKEKTVFDVKELVRRVRLGQTERAIGRQMGFHRVTVKKYRQLAESHGWLEKDSPLPEPGMVAIAVQKTKPGRTIAHEVSSVEPYRVLIGTLLQEGDISASVIHQRLVDNGYLGSYSSVRRFMAKLRGPTVPEGFCRIEVAPGSEAQVDFGYVGKLFDPIKQIERSGWVFVMTLSHSRHMFVKIVFDQSSWSWLQLHREAFEFFGGVPGKIVLDNLKAAIVKAAIHDPQIQRSYRDQAEYYGFVVDPNRPHTPRHKGKVERSVRYIKQNFMPGRRFCDIDDANEQLQQWNAEKAGCRVHGTTGWKPMEQFTSVEQAALLPLPLTRWEPSIWKEVKLQSDCYLNVEKSFYSAPFRLIDQQLMVQVTPDSVRIYHDLELVATHRRAQVPRSRMANQDHFPPHKVALLKATPQWCFKKAEEIGPATLEWMQRYLSDPVMEKVRSGFIALGLAEKFTSQRLEMACRRALDFDEISFATLKRILERGLDQEPWGNLLHPTPPAAIIPMPMPRYTRDVSHYFVDRREVF